MKGLDWLKPTNTLKEVIRGLWITRKDKRKGAKHVTDEDAHNLSKAVDYSPPTKEGYTGAGTTEASTIEETKTEVDMTKENKKQAKRRRQKEARERA